MNDRLVIGIVAHKQRYQMARNLMDRTDADILRIDHREWVSLARAIDNCTENHITVLEDLYRETPAADWCVVLEDDAVPVPEFRAELRRALDAAPSRLVGLYLGSGNPSGPVQRAINAVIDRPEAWLVSDALIQTVGYAVHRSLIPDVLVDVEDQAAGEMPKRLTRWSQSVGMDWAYTHPSLIDHDDRGSVIYPGVPEVERRKLPRRAHRYGTRADWRGEVRLPPFPKWSREPAVPASS
jgi:hypothetical protein